MPKIVGASSRVVDHEGLTIDELAGNVATSNDRISIAHVKVANASSEPWLTLHYDEWMCVLKGRMVLLHGDNQQMEVKTGQTVYIEKGERFRPTFPDAGTEYVPVCLPAFRPDRCIREEEEGGAVSANLAKLHSKPSKTADEQLPEQLYHMCEAAQWEAAKRTGVAYFPPTFEVCAPSATRRNMGRYLLTMSLVRGVRAAGGRPIHPRHRGADPAHHHRQPLLSGQPWRVGVPALLTQRAQEARHRHPRRGGQARRRPAGR